MRIITGRSKTGKSTYIYRSIKDDIDREDSCNHIVLVPDLMTYQTEYHIIQTLNIEGISDIQVYTFKRLAREVLREVGRETEEIGSFGKTMILNKIFLENRDKLKLYKDSILHPGFLKKFEGLVVELKQNLITVDDLVKAMEEIENSLLKDKLSDIIILYKSYQDKIGEILYDEEDINDLFRENISKSTYIKNSKIWIDGFESFSTQRVETIRELSKSARDISVSLNIDSEYLDDLESFDDYEAFKVIYDTAISIKEIEGENKWVNLSQNIKVSDEISWIEKNLFSLDTKKYERETDNIEIYSSMNSYSEVEKTAEKIVSLVRDKGYRWKDIKVAVGDLDLYIEDIKKIFKRFNIPYFADTNIDITNSPLVRYILSLLDIFIWNFRYADVFDYLKTGLTNMSDNDVNCIENYTLMHGIEGEKWFKEVEVEFIENIRENFISNFKDSRKRFENLNTIEEITAFIFQYLELHEVDKKISELILSFKWEKNYEKASEYSQIWNNVMEIFDEISKIGGEDKITPLEYRNMIETAFQGVNINIIPPTIDRVEIGNIERIAVTSSKALFVIGANEGNLDSDKLRSLLLDSEMDLLCNRGIEIMNCSDYLYFKKKHMIYKLFTSPKEKLYTSYSLGNTDGGSMEPSLYINILKMIFPYILEETDISKSKPFDHISNCDTSYDILVENIRDYLNGYQIDDIWKSVYSWYKDNRHEKFNMIGAGLNYKNEVSKISDMSGVFPEEINTTVSKLENYLRCPFRYFVENALKARPRPSQKVEFYDIGNIYHNILEGFINKIIESDKNIEDISDEEVIKYIDEAITHVFKKSESQIPALNMNKRNSYLKNKIERVSIRTANTLISQLKKSNFKPQYTELKIGDLNRRDEENRLNIPALEIETGNHKIKLRGKIDRIDTFEDDDGEVYLSIIDYKSSSKDIDFTDLYDGMGIQLLVYLKAVIENGEKIFSRKPKVAGVYYYHIDDPIIEDGDKDIEAEILKSLKLRGLTLKDEDVVKHLDKDISGYSDIIPVALKSKGGFYKTSKVFSEDEFDAILDFVSNKISDLSEDIFDGNFPIYPFRKNSGASPCSYCDYMCICQFDRNLGNEYRRVANIAKDDFLDKISEKVVD